MSPQQELEVLAIQARQAVQVVDALRDRLEALSDPHNSFARHADHLTACIYLLRAAADEVAAIAKGEAQRERFVKTGSGRVVTP
ncbi:MAG: hypothetical protein WAT39_23875 [Planctomycetota bacterium]